MDVEIATAPSPFHAGERQVQDRLGVGDIEEWARKVVRPHMPAEHRDFHTALPFLVASARDAQGRPWATLLTGPDGFVTWPDPRSLAINAVPARGDALEDALTPGADVGILGIELSTRRRNRVNGRLQDSNARTRWSSPSISPSATARNIFASGNGAGSKTTFPAARSAAIG